MSTPSPNPFSDNPPPGAPLNPYAPPQAQGGHFVAPPGMQQFAPCPKCGNTFASTIGFTWWGGMLGPSLMTHVKCYRCGNAYNGKTGQSNATAITIYVIVSTIIAIAIAIGLAVMGVFS